jgi:phosphoglycerate dehydrogenase-like enzyme
MQVLMYAPSYARIRAQLEQSVPGVEAVLMSADGSLAIGGRRIEPAAAAPVAAWSNSDLYAGGPLREFMVRCLKTKSLRWVQSSAAGFDHSVFSKLVDNGVLLSTSHASAISVAEFVIAAVFDALQPQRRRRELQREQRWERTDFREVYGSRWMIIGMGNIGREIATRARALGAEVSGVRRCPRGDEPAQRVLAINDKPAIFSELAQCHVVVACAPKNRDSEGLIGDEFLSHMNSESVLINVGRGALLDERSLLRELDRGRPALAVLDVFETEPLPATSPLWRHPRVRVSAHSAALGDGFVARGDAIFLANLKRFASGAQPLFVADPAAVRQAVADQQS